jgi:hypothetical protein
VLCSLILLVIDAYTPLESVEWMLHVLLVWGVSFTGAPRQLVWAGVLSSACIAGRLRADGAAISASLGSTYQPCGGDRNHLDHRLLFLETEGCRDSRTADLAGVTGIPAGGEETLGIDSDLRGLQAHPHR